MDDHPDSFVYYHGAINKFVKRTMCVFENNVPTDTYVDEPCPDFIHVNVYKPYTTKLEI